MRSYQNRVRKILAGGVHYNFNLPWDEYPLHFVKGKNSRLWDMNGKEYLDFYARFGASILGHSNEEYCDTLKATIDRILCVSHSDLDAETLEILSKLIPSAECIRFGLSGTETIQNALRLARAFTGKNRFIRFEGHYHGNADNIMGGKVPKGTNDYIPKEFLGDFKHTAGRAVGSLEDNSFLLPWNNIDVLEDVLIKHANEIAAIITEPICVTSGSLMPAAGYLEKMRSLCDKYHVVLIFDEVITGCRTGVGGAQKLLNIVPDLSVFGKAIAGGAIPVSVLAGKKEIMQLLIDKKVIHAGTFNGYPLGAAAVKTTLEILSRDNESAIFTMNETVTQIHDILKARADAIELPLIIQGPPGCAAYHCTDTILKNPEDYTDELMMMDIILNNNLAENGILVSTFSRIYPNISLNHEDVEYFRKNVDNALIETKSIYQDMILSNA